ncbi:MAG TPA: thioredoxin-disulfide reductase [Ignavibacteria bacterium]|nr:thioredoxin-disulfide reductase [Ignavibacteria bacterium]HAX50124.1 thioredoxin-disulfide reductase [Bacteroidota bacterium]HRE11185.1 thioredoxin-disulfide reductase [Ignavibacteria bacterium]HRF64775.1 thioredoxin-disulfide reductase [Ignavibacteria bacterium]HRJ05568.1 thioredoxin-disulfide reductase [Ignavibacteria bacterium]
MSEQIVHNVIIIGSGPAGLTAALYTGRANLNPIVFEGMQPGGQLTITTEVENYPGFEHGIMGPELMDVMRKQAQRFGADCQFKFVDKVDFSSSPFKLHVEGKEYLAKSVIIATGASAKLLGLPSESEYMGFGVSACATCDGFFFKDQRIIVIGGGDTAMEEANYLTKFGKEVMIVHRREEFRASKIMLERAMKNPKIKLVTDTVLEEVIGVTEGSKKRVTHAKLKNVKTGEVTDQEVEGIFLGIGHKPNTDIFKGQIELEDTGYIKTSKVNTNTNIPGVFACGDAQDHVYRQAITAAGSGCMAAIDAERYLESIEEHS